MQVKLAATEKKDDKKNDECKCCSKPGPCGCCGGTYSDASIHNTGFFLNGDHIDRGSNIIIYGNGATVTNSGGGVANSGGHGPGGGNGGGYVGGSGRSAGSESSASGSSPAGSSPAGSSSHGHGGKHKKLDKAGRAAARKEMRHRAKQALSRRPTNANYARYVGSYRKNMLRIYRSYRAKLYHYRRRLSRHRYAKGALFHQKRAIREHWVCQRSYV